MRALAVLLAEWGLVGAGCDGNVPPPCLDTLTIPDGGTAAKVVRWTPNPAVECFDGWHERLGRRLRGLPVYQLLGRLCKARDLLRLVGASLPPLNRPAVVRRCPRGQGIELAACWFR